jgi:hypothetical protein
MAPSPCGGKEVGLLKVDRVDLGELDEVVNVDRLGPAGVDGVHLLVSNQDIVTLAHALILGHFVYDGGEAEHCGERFVAGDDVARWCGLGDFAVGGEDHQVLHQGVQPGFWANLWLGHAPHRSCGPEIGALCGQAHQALRGCRAVLVVVRRSRHGPEGA